MKNGKSIKNLPIRKSTLLIIFAVLLVILLIIIGILGTGLIKISRINQFSKNISLSNNYFLSKYTDAAGEASLQEARSDLAENEFAGYQSEISQAASHSANSFLLQLEDMYFCGTIDRDEYEEICDYFSLHSLGDTVRFANQLLGWDWFSASDYAYDIDVPYISQAGILPNGCEAVSAVMLLHFYGFSIDPIDFVDTYLEQGEVYIKWGCRYGPNPMKQYAGDPKSEKGGWGCFAPVIIKALNQYLDEKAFAKNLTGLSLEEIVQQYIVQGIPVAIWCTQGMKEISSLYQWQSYDKSESFLYPVSEHCIVLTGFDDQYYYFNDPLDEEQKVKYEKSLACASFNSMGRQAVAILIEGQDTE